MCSLLNFIAFSTVIITLAFLTIAPLYFVVNFDSKLNISTLVVTDAVWKPVFGSEHYLIYSAYVESRKGGAEIRLIGTSHRDKTDQIFCKLWFEDDGVGRFEVVEAEKDLIQENWGRVYSASYFLCPLKNLTTIPSSVSLYTTFSQNVSSFHRNMDKFPKIKVQNRLESERVVQTGAPKLAACVAPLYNYSNPWTLIEWIEVNRLLGYDHFHLYVYSTAKNVSCVLNNYAKQGLVTILDWHENQEVLMLERHERNIRIMNLFAALNECLYRGMYKFRYLAFHDVDEFLVPQENLTLTKFMEKLEARHNDTAAFIFKNSFYFTHRPDDPDYKGPFDLITLRKTTRNQNFLAMHVRSKYVVRADVTEQVGNHNLYHAIGNFKMEAEVDEKEASNRHYRFCDFDSTFCNATTVQDRRMWDFQQQLVKRMEEVQRTIAVECQLKPFNRTEMLKK
ncbi:uncharacterized protein LOC135946861 [Cloeon dipterum]|uniref:uncharacterized protein LOC135946861 n=1 Tax=Cloeon dipterum TaxID=197152 RepID=UPI00321FA301